MPPTECADGYYSRTEDGRKTGQCNAVEPGFVASAGKIDELSNTARECLANSVPDVTRSRCLCKPGYFQVLGGQTPRCAECVGAMSYNDEPSTRMTCKICPVGKVANTDKTGCGERLAGQRGGPTAPLAGFPNPAARWPAHPRASLPFHTRHHWCPNPRSCPG